LGWPAGRQCGAHGDSAHPVLARETCDRGAFVTERRPHLLKLVVGECGWPAAVAAFGFGRGDPFDGQFRFAGRAGTARRR
jgi:hypothetical protein